MKRCALFICLVLVSTLLRAETGRGIIIRGQFADTEFSISEAQSQAIADRASAWLDAQFSPGKTFSFDLGPVVTLSGWKSMYASNSSEIKDVRIGEAVREACILSNNDVDFSKYEYLIVMFSGGSEADGAGSDCVWPQQSTLSDYGTSLTLDGTVLNSFIDFTETCRAGTLCHEFMHTLGLEDLYDTDGEWSGGLSKGLCGSLSIMDKGLWNGDGQTPPFLNAIELDALGMGTCKDLTPGSHTLPPIGSSRTYLKHETGTKGEYYLFECRKAESWDEFIGGEGLLVYHIDKSAENAWYSDYYKRNLTGAERWQFNQINCRPDHECALVMEADPHSNSIADVFFPRDSHTSFGSDTEPSWRYWNGETSPYALTGIRMLPDGSVSFDVITPITMKSCEVFQDAAILKWSIDPHLADYQCEVSWTEGYSTRTEVVHPVSALNYAFTVEGLKGGTDYNISIRTTDNNGSAFSTTVRCTTKPILDGVHPYIYLNESTRNSDGSFQIGSSLLLRVFNAAGVAETRWHLDGKRIEPAPDGRYTITCSGTLKAEVFYVSGGKDIIIKEITAR